MFPRRLALVLLALVPAAAYCGPDHECLQQEDCGDGEFCQIGCGGPNVCVALLTDGQACGLNAVCAEGLVCNQAFRPPVCKAPAAGLLCTTDGECTLSIVRDLACNTTVTPAVCTPTASLELGAPCVGRLLCAAELECWEGACAARSGPGEPCPCDPDQDAYCDVPADVCRPALEEGDACDGDPPCGSDLHCDLLDTGRCRRVPRAGDPCSAQSDCGILMRCFAGVCSG